MYLTVINLKNSRRDRTFQRKFSLRSAGFRSPLVLVYLGVLRQILVLTAGPAEQQYHGYLVFVDDEDVVVLAILLIVRVVWAREFNVILEVV